MALLAARFADNQVVEIAGVAVRLKVSSRARRVSLRVDRARREMLAIAPNARRLPEAVDFARRNETWIATQIAGLAAPAALPIGAELDVLGQVWRLEPDGRRPRLSLAGPDPDLKVLSGCGLGEVDVQLVTRLVKREALATFTDRARVHCKTLGVNLPPVSLFDARTRWGSCTRDLRGRGGEHIRVSWRLALAPLEVADYVVAHECAHLIEANHGPKFWAVCRSLVGSERPHRQWLKAHGNQLHAFGRS